MAHLEEIISNAQLTASQSLVNVNQRLCRWLESPFLPFSEKQEIRLQIEENLVKLGKLNRIHKIHEAA